MLDNTGKCRPKSFLHWKDCLFFSKICVFNNLLGPEKCSYEIHSKSQNTLWTFIKCFMSFSLLDNTGKSGQTFFFHWKDCLFFSEVRVFNNLVGPKKCCCNLYSKGQNSQWTLGKRSMMFVTFDNTSKNGPKVLPFWKMPFSRTFVFSTPYVPKKWSYHLHIICQITFWTLIKRFPIFVMFDNTGKMSQNFFVLGKSAFFLEKTVFSTTLRS